MELEATADRWRVTVARHTQVAASLFSRHLKCTRVMEYFVYDLLFGTSVLTCKP
jgi:hypothetical protein